MLSRLVSVTLEIEDAEETLFGKRLHGSIDLNPTFLKVELSDDEFTPSIAFYRMEVPGLKELFPRTTGSYLVCRHAGGLLKGLPYNRQLIHVYASRVNSSKRLKKEAALPFVGSLRSTDPRHKVQRMIGLFGTISSWIFPILVVAAIGILIMYIIIQ